MNFLFILWTMPICVTCEGFGILCLCVSIYQLALLLMLFRMLGICFIGDLLTQTMLTCDTVLPYLAVTSPFEMPEMPGRLFCV